MTSPLPPVLSSRTTATAQVPLIRLDRWSDVVLRMQPQDDAGSAQPARRSKIWELSETLHCSIIGTCLSNAELRNVLVRLNAKGVESADEHELHVLGVMLAGRRESGAKLLQRALDRRHGLAIKQYARAKDEETLRRMWDESVRSGDIPGAYWALLSHPVASDAIVRKAFRDVHMLSHLVGAANRADIRRLRQLEEDIGVLTGKLDRQQQQLRDGFTSRDETIRQLKQMLIHKVEQSTDAAALGADAGSKIEALRSVIAELNRKLGQETARREKLEQRLQAVSASLQKMEAALRTTADERDALVRDLGLVEDRLSGLLQSSDDNVEGSLELAGRTILYVGGRANQIPQLKAMVERMGARFLHHDGGIEHSAALLPGLVGRADHLFFPVDCISHDAVATIKKLCRQLERPYHPLRTASLATLVASLSMASRNQGVERVAETP